MFANFENNSLAKKLNMPFPSIHYLTDQAKKSIIRFPWVIGSGFVAALVTVYLISIKSVADHMPILNLILCAALGISLFFSMAVTSQKKGWSKKKSHLANIAVLVLFATLYFTFPVEESARNTSQPYIRFVLYALSAHLFVSFMPFIGNGQLNGYWQYNKSLFLRLFLSVIYSG